MLWKILELSKPKSTVALKIVINPAGMALDIKKSSMVFSWS